MPSSYWSTAPTGARSRRNSPATSDLGLSATVSTRDDADAVRVLYEDIDNDQRFWNALSALVLFAAALAAFNLINRIVEAQRREIGIGMALGVTATTRDSPHAHRRPGRRSGLIAGLAVRFLVERLREPPRIVPPAPRTPHQSSSKCTSELLHSGS